MNTTARKIIGCTLKEKYTEFSREVFPFPFPGSLEAADEGCTCPERQPWPKGFLFASDCPLHQLKKTGEKFDA